MTNCSPAAWQRRCDKPATDGSSSAIRINGCTRVVAGRSATARPSAVDKQAGRASSIRLPEIGAGAGRRTG
jgi:hypothetical protein